jgi:hypothetical protein
VAKDLNPEQIKAHRIAAGLSSFSNDSASQKLKGGQGNAASFGVDHETGKPKHAPTHKKLRAKDRPLANDFVSDDEFYRLTEYGKSNSVFAQRLHSDFDRAGFDVGFDRLRPRGSCRDFLTMVAR